MTFEGSLGSLEGITRSLAASKCTGLLSPSKVAFMEWLPVEVAQYGVKSTDAGSPCDRRVKTSREARSSQAPFLRCNSCRAPRRGKGSPRCSEVNVVKNQLLRSRAIAQT